MKGLIAIGFVAGLTVGAATTYVVTSNSYSSATATATGPACTNEAIATAIAQQPNLCPKPDTPPIASGLEQPNNDEASLAFRERLDAVKSWNSTVKIGSCKEGGIASHITCGVEVDWKGDGHEIEQRSVGFTKSANGWIAQLY